MTLLTFLLSFLPILIFLLSCNGKAGKEELEISGSSNGVNKIHHEVVFMITNGNTMKGEIELDDKEVVREKRKGSHYSGGHHSNGGHSRSSSSRKGSTKSSTSSSSHSTSSTTSSHIGTSSSSSSSSSHSSSKPSSKSSSTTTAHVVIALSNKGSHSSGNKQSSSPSTSTNTTSSIPENMDVKTADKVEKTPTDSEKSMNKTTATAS